MQDVHFEIVLHASLRLLLKLGERPQMPRQQQLACVVYGMIDAIERVRQVPLPGHIGHSSRPEDAAEPLSSLLDRYLLHDPEISHGGLVATSRSSTIA